MLWQCRNYRFDTRMPIIMGILFVDELVKPCANLDESLDALLEQAHAQRSQGVYLVSVRLEKSSFDSLDHQALERICAAVRKLADQGLCVAAACSNSAVLVRLLESGLSVWEGACLSVLHGNPELAQQLYQDKVGLILPNTAVRQSHLASLAGDFVEQSCKAVRLDCEEWLKRGFSQEQILINPLLPPDQGGALNERTTCADAPLAPEDERLILRNLSEFLRLGFPLQIEVDTLRFIESWYKPNNNEEMESAIASETLLAAQAGVSVFASSDIERLSSVLQELRPQALICLQANEPLLAGEVTHKDALEAQINLGVACLCQIPDGDLIDVSSCVFEVAEGGESRPDSQGICATAVALVRTGVAPHELQKLLDYIPRTLGVDTKTQNDSFALKLTLLDYQAYTCSDAELTLPHTELLESNAVAKALYSIRPRYQAFYEKG